MPDLQIDSEGKGVMLKLHPMAVPPPRKAKKPKAGLAVASAPKIKKAKPAPSNTMPKRAKTAMALKKAV